MNRKYEDLKTVLASSRSKAGILGSMLLTTEKIYGSKLLEMLVESGFTDVTMSHMALVPLIDVHGVRATELAQMLALSKQAIGKIIDDLEQKGYVERIADPEDGRAKTVLFTLRGLELLRMTRMIDKKIEKEFSQIVSRKRLIEMKKTLSSLVS